MLEFAQDCVVIVDEPQVDETGKVLLFGRREVTASSGLSHDLLDQREMVQELPLVVHATLW
jgi:hypothetical protein